MRAPEITEKLRIIGVRALSHDPADLPRFLRAENERWGALVRESGLKVE